MLWNDIIRAGTSENIPNHFVGSFVYVQDGQNQVFSATPECMVIDGQQRMTTISLLLLALADSIQKSGHDLKISQESKVSANYIKNNYLLNSNEDGDKRYKLILTQSDRKLPRQVDSSKVEFFPASNRSRNTAGGKFPSASWGRSSL